MFGGSNKLDQAVETGLRPFVYRYREARFEPKSQPNGGEYAGILAQNLQKHPLTAQTVTHTPDGLKVEIGPMVSLLSGVAGRHNERLDHHEGLIHSLRGVLKDHEHALNKLHEIIGRRLGK